MAKAISKDPEIVRRVGELEALLTAGNDAWHSETITDRVKIARMRLISKELRSKMADLKIYCQMTGNWIEDEVC